MKKAYRYLVLLWMSWTVSPVVFAQKERNLLSRFSTDEIARSLLPREQWKPFSKTGIEWQKILPDSVRNSIILDAEKYRQAPFEAIPASLMLEYQRTGIRINYENVSLKKRAQLFTLLLAEVMDNKGLFLDAITDGIWSICEESFWGVPAHLYQQKAGLGLVDTEDPSVDLFVSDTGTLLALADYFLGSKLDSISPLIRKRIYKEVNTRMFTPFEKDSGRYWYLQKGRKEAPVNNWNPWVISNWMASVLLLEKDDTRRAKELHHALTLLDHYLNWLGDDGAIDEGPSYWNGAIGRLFDALVVLESASAGRLTIYQEPLIQNAGTYLYKMHIAGNYFINVADASPVVHPDGVQLYRIGKTVQDTIMRDFGAWTFHNGLEKRALSNGSTRLSVLWNLLAFQECVSRKGRPPMLADVWLPSIQQMAGRTPGGLFVASHGGHNAESHNHNDVGDFIAYANGQPVIIDVGFGTYTAKTFSKERYSLWYNSSAYHNLPVINGFQQAAGGQYEARNVTYNKTTGNSILQMDLAAAYPAEAGVQKWQRTVALEKTAHTVSITDDYVLQQPVRELTQTFMTVCPVDLSQAGKIRFDIPGSKPASLDYDASAWTVKKELMPGDAPDEKRLVENWGRRPIWRILLVSKTKQKAGKFKYVITQ
ncbi:heparinase II/III domain-containing protein [Larkinella punicea]|uniref:Heparinase II/III-like C-terminal domain-containing protein n=1 Tax=Larkinella punicea TaxID=2315727 RepID=A0A368JV38_9BACT|nr:heparinase II/III family protein [Larkinella punicea]RCR71530.1 hypothetical protein DUE52_00960 [Larkinella punicea]